MSDMRSKVESWLKKDVGGTFVFEWVITLPALFAITFISIFLVILLLSYANFCGLASNVSSSINFRSTGMTNAVKQYNYNSSNPIVKACYGVTTVNGTSGNDFSKAVSYIVYSEGGGIWEFPYVDSGISATPRSPYAVDVTLSRVDAAGNTTPVTLTTSSATAKDFSNVVVQTNIRYRFAPIRIMGLEILGVSVNAEGYGVMT